MNKDKIVAIYETTQDKVNKTLRAAGLDHKAPDFSRKDLELFDETWVLVEGGMSITDATKEMKRRAEAANNPYEKEIALDPKLTAYIDQQLEEVTKNAVGQAPHLIKEQQERLRLYIVQKFWRNINALGESGELKKAFDAVLGSDDVIEATVLPGEQPALPENSSSGT